MIILKSLTSNEIKFIAREGSPYRISLRDEQTKEETLYSPTFITEDYYTTCEITHNFIEGRSYSIVVLETGVSRYINRVETDLGFIESIDCIGDILNEEPELALYRGLMFCTTQKNEDYTMNEGKYDIPEEDNTNAKYNIITK